MSMPGPKVQSVVCLLSRLDVSYILNRRLLVQGSCKEAPPEPKSLRDSSLTDEGSVVPVADSSNSWQSPQCVIKVPSVLLHIEGTGSAFHVTGDGTASSTGEPNTSGDSSGLGGRRLLEAALSLIHI